MLNDPSSTGPDFRTCVECNAGPMDKENFIAHILGKRHQKKRQQKGFSGKRTLYVQGYALTAPHDDIVRCFWKYGVCGASCSSRFSFIEFETEKGFKEALKSSIRVGGKKLILKPKRDRSNSKGEYEDYGGPPLSFHLRNRLNRVMKTDINDCIRHLIREIELRPLDYTIRENLRVRVEMLLSDLFPNVQAFIFGSSNNNLGFIGCDIDVFVQLQYDPWACGGKVEKEMRAAELTYFLAKLLRQTRGIINVQAVPRARVPIVKFVDASTSIQIDLSFRNKMPIYNTNLIYLYTRTHPLVRPYLMIIRYWARIQNIAGGGKPVSHITNYAFTMMMIFYLMLRKDPVVPSVADLQRKPYPISLCPVFVGGWDCTFREDVREWSSRHHDITVFELIIEFFEFYGTLNLAEWVLCPLLGRLIARKDMESKNEALLPTPLRHYCRQEGYLQVDKPLCVQDPFDHIHNITRGLRSDYVAVFQYKCRRAHELCNQISSGDSPLGELFQLIEISGDVDLNVSSISNVTQEEVIVLDDSDVSQDSVKVIENEVPNLTSQKDDKEKDSEESKHDENKETFKQRDSETAEVSLSAAAPAADIISPLEVSDSTSNGDTSEKQDNHNNNTDRVCSAEVDKESGLQSVTVTVETHAPPHGHGKNSTLNSHSTDWWHEEMVAETQEPAAEEIANDKLQEKPTEDERTINGQTTSEDKNNCVSNIEIGDSGSTSGEEALRNDDMCPISSKFKKQRSVVECQMNRRSELSEPLDITRGHIEAVTHKNTAAEGDSDIEIVEPNSRAVSPLNQNKNKSEETEIVDHNREIVICTATPPNEQSYKFDLNFVSLPEFELDKDMKINAGNGTFKGENVSSVVCAIVEFVLRDCLKMEIRIVEDYTDTQGKRKAEGELGSKKRLKTNSGDSHEVRDKFRCVRRYLCTSHNFLWVGRRKVAKQVISSTLSPFEHEMEVTKTQLAKVSAISDTSKELHLQFGVVIWQECERPFVPLVTAQLRSSSRIARGHMGVMFTYVASLSQTLLRQTVHYVRRTS